jgi:hypothetical protein
MPCSEETKTFKTSKHRDMWSRLHDKKCETCAGMPTIHTGTNVEEYNHRITTSQEVVRRMINQQITDDRMNIL